MTRAKLRQVVCPFCTKKVGVKTDGKVMPHINWGDQARTGNCYYSGIRVLDDNRLGSTSEQP